ARVADGAPGGRPPSDRGADQRERAIVRTVVDLEPAWLPRAPRVIARDTGRTGAAVRRGHLPAGGAQPDAGAAPRRPRHAGSSGIRADVRRGACGALWESAIGTRGDRAARGGDDGARDGRASVR